MSTDDYGVRYDVELPVGVVDLGKLCSISVHTRRISVQGHLLRNFEDYRGRGVLAVGCSCNARHSKLMISTSGSGDLSAFLRQIMVFRNGIYASIDFFPVSNKVMEDGNGWQWSVLTRSLNHRLVPSYLRDDFNPPFIALFAVLYFLRSFHWIAGDRIDYVSPLDLS